LDRHGIYVWAGNYFALAAAERSGVGDNCGPVCETGAQRFIFQTRVKSNDNVTEWKWFYQKIMLLRHPLHLVLRRKGN